MLAAAALTCVTILDELGSSLQLLARPPVDLGLDLGELASNVGCVTVQHRGIAVAYLARVVHDDDLQQPACHQALLTFVDALLAGLDSFSCLDAARHMPAPDAASVTVLMDRGTIRHVGAVTKADS